MSERYDMCVIGAGTAGFAAAQAIRAAGRSVVLVSGPGDLGGTCILRGCMPAKALLGSTEELAEVEKAHDFGVKTGEVRIDVPAMIARKRELTDYFTEDRVHELKAYPLVRGSARFLSRDAIEVDGRRIEAERFLIATGSHIVAPPISGLAEAGFITSDDVLEMSSIPASIVIAGGGPVGCEFAQYFARLGARVTLLEDGPTLLRNEDDDVAAAVAALLKHEGVEIVFDAAIEHCKRDGAETIVTFTESGAATSIRVAALMLASHRVPNLAGLELASAGVLSGDGRLAIDPYLRTTNHRIFAAGDVLGRRCLVHVAEYAGKLAAQNAYAEHPIAADFDRFEAHAIYTQPQVAVAGLTERTCRERRLRINVRRHPFGEVGKAVLANAPEGFVKLIAAEDGRILGAAIVGENAIDLIGEAIALIDLGAGVSDVAGMPHLHPTMGEIFARVAEDFAE